MQNGETIKMSTRILAYLLDVMLVFIVISLVTSIRFINPSYDKYYESYEKYSEVLEDYYNGNITERDMLKLNADNYYNLSKYSISYNIAIIIILILYFVIFQKYNGGKTLGKHIMKIKVASTNKEDVSIISYLIRSIFIYFIYIGSIIPLIINTILVFIISSKYYMIVSTVINYVFLILSLINLIVMFVRKDKRGLHDIIAHTKIEKI